jgi:outer membrane protein assembly factor BamB
MAGKKNDIGLVFKKAICGLAALSVAATVGCTSYDPILEGKRVPVFRPDAPIILGRRIDDLGGAVSEKECGYSIAGNNQIWRDKDNARIFAGLPTESKIDAPKRVVCGGDFIYAGLSTGELVKVNAKTRDLAWTADVFAEHLPVGGSPFLDIIAAPTVNGGFVYAGGLGGAFCKLRETDGKKVWCLPISAQAVLKKTDKFHFVLSADNDLFAVSNDGKIYWTANVADNDRDFETTEECAMGVNLADGEKCRE